MILQKAQFILYSKEIGLSLLKNLEPIIFMKSQWEVEQLNKHLIHMKVYPRWKVWILILILQQKHNLQNS
jgi:hypothetical protein